MFDRHLLVSAALFETWKDNAREAQNIANAGIAAMLAGATAPLIRDAVGGRRADRLQP